MERTISSRQLMALSFVSMLSPFLRLIPGAVTSVSGSASWVSAALSILPIVLLSAALTALLGRFPKGTGLSTAVLRTMGRFPGSLLLSLWALWLVFHSGFLLCSGAHRFIVTIYPGVRPTIFIWITAALCVIAALGAVKSIARASEIFRPLLLFVILIVLFFTIQETEPTFLLPVTVRQVPAILKGIPLAAEAVSVILVNSAFLANCIVPDNTPHKRFPWLLGVTILAVLFCVTAVGSLGKTYVSALSYPFFIMARDLSILSGVERIEALVVGLWLIPDFVLISVELMIAADTMLLITNQQSSQNARTAWILIGCAISVFMAFRIAPNSESLVQWSEKIIPAIHLGWAYLVIPLVLLVSNLRKKF